MGKKVLVIDDEPALVDLVRTWLESRDYEVIPALPIDRFAGILYYTLVIMGYV